MISGTITFSLVIGVAGYLQHRGEPAQWFRSEKSEVDEAFRLAREEKEAAEAKMRMAKEKADALAKHVEREKQAGMLNVSSQGSSFVSASKSVEVKENSEDLETDEFRKFQQITQSNFLDGLNFSNLTSRAKGMTKRDGELQDATEKARDRAYDQQQSEAWRMQELRRLDEAEKKLKDRNDLVRAQIYQVTTLDVTSAKYGSVDNPEISLDVLERVNHLIHKNGIKNFTGCQSLNNIAGDPAFQEFKKLVITRGTKSLTFFEDAQKGDCNYNLEPLYMDRSNVHEE